MEYYVFDTESEAQAAELHISLLGSAPIVGFRASDNSPQPSKQQTTRWAIPVQRATDGKWVFPRVSTEVRARFSQEQVTAFQAAHTYTIEEEQPDWFPIPEYV